MLNRDMERQAADNTNLVSTLTSAKEGNKRLIEQIRQQTEEVVQLTHARVMEEERAQQLESQLRFEQQHFRRETSRRLGQIQQDGLAQFSACRSSLEEQMNIFVTRVELLREAIVLASSHHREQTRLLHQELEFCSVDMNSAFSSVLRGVDQSQRKSSQNLVDLSHTAVKLDQQLIAMKAARQQEVFSWSQRHTVCASRQEDCCGKLSRDCSVLTGSVDAVQRTLCSEEANFSAENARAQEEFDRMSGQRDIFLKRSSSSERTINELRSAYSSAQQEWAATNAQSDQLISQIRESEDALAAADNGNQHLRTQLDEQARRFSIANERQVAEAQLRFHNRVEQLQARSKGALSCWEQQLARAADDLQHALDALEQNSQSCDQRERDLDTLQRELGQWKQHLSAATRSRSGLETQQTHDRQGWLSLRLQLQQQSQEIESCRDTVGRQVEESHKAVSLLQRNSKHDEVTFQSRISEVADSIKDAQLRLDDAKTVWIEISEALSKARVDTKDAERRSQEYQACHREALLSHANNFRAKNMQLDEQLQFERQVVAQLAQDNDKLKLTHQMAVGQMALQPPRVFGSALHNSEPSAQQAANSFW
jgi:hypothetical protein